MNINTEINMYKDKTKRTQIRNIIRMEGSTLERNKFEKKGVNLLKPRGFFMYHQV
jgi:hypothetical protein